MESLPSFPGKWRPMVVRCEYVTALLLASFGKLSDGRVACDAGRRWSKWSADPAPRARVGSLPVCLHPSSLGPPSTSITGDAPVPVPTRQLAERSQHECTYSDAATLSRAMESTEVVDGARNAANEHFSPVVRAACRQVAGYGACISCTTLIVGGLSLFGVSSDSHQGLGGIQGDVRCGVHDPAGR